LTAAFAPLAAQNSSMTTARSGLMPPGQAGTFHITARCVRRAFLWGFDRYAKRNFEHRKPWVEQRILMLSNTFAVSLLSFAVMSNHLHLVIASQPAAVTAWSDAEIAARWVRIYPPKYAKDVPAKIAGLLKQPEYVLLLRGRLSNLSWFMKTLQEPIAKRANKEDRVKGRFFEGRFKNQALLSQDGILAAMVYVDLNPIRAKMVDSLGNSKNTGIWLRMKNLLQDQSLANQPMTPIAGLPTFQLPAISEAQYIELADKTGRQMHPGKRGVINANDPPALRKLGLDMDHWAMQVKGIGSGYWRAVGTVEDLMAKAAEIGQNWLCGIGFARFFKS